MYTVTQPPTTKKERRQKEEKGGIKKKGKKEEKGGDKKTRENIRKFYKIRGFYINILQQFSQQEV